MSAGREWREVDPDWEAGDISCECGRMVTLYYNGGELDQKTCSCGRSYRTVAKQIVLEMREAAVRAIAERAAP